MATPLTLSAVRRAWELRDPQFPELVAQLAVQDDPMPETPVRDGVPTFANFLTEIRSPACQRKPADEQMAVRRERLATLERPDAENPLPDRLRLHEILLALAASDDPLARDALLRVVAVVPLVYGPWRAVKRLFKEAEAAGDWELYGAIAARVDAAWAEPRTPNSVSPETTGYLRRRAWRRLRRVALHLPATYADVAVEVLRHYQNSQNTDGCWVLNHVLFHATGRYGRGDFYVNRSQAGKLGVWKHRAYPDLWTRSPRPLFTLLERAQSDLVREFAAAGLVADFASTLREVEADWVARLVGVESPAVDEFVVWILQNVPKFEQGAFRKLKLHDAVLKLLDSRSASAAKYAADYARVHARDLSVDELVRLFGSSQTTTRQLARDLLGERDPRGQVGLEAWGRLLELPHARAFASEVLLKSFGARELTPEWFAGRLLSGSESAQKFAVANVLRLHPASQLGGGYFVGLARRTSDENPQHRQLLAWVVGELKKLDFAGVPEADLRWLTLHPATAPAVLTLVADRTLRPQRLGVDFLKALAFEPDWQSHPTVADLRASGLTWPTLDFDEARSAQMLELLGDVRAFSTAEIGLDWLLTLANRAEPAYQQFARDRMVRTLAPADFAPSAGATVAVAAPAEAADLGGKSFLFTGTLATMKRDDAEARVKAANGVVAGSVTKKLTYLVVGDEGSPLYGSGKKGSKQVKAEQLNEAGANIAIVSETAFLQMLAGTARPAEADADAARAGTERLFAMATAAGSADAPLAGFAREYLAKHHRPIAQQLTGKPPDPGTEVPPELLTWDRFRPLFAETRRPLRDFALQFAQADFARWNPGADDLLALAENPFVDVRRFVAQALLAEPAKEAQGYRLDAAKLDAAGIYRFVESGEPEARALGLELIRRRPELAVPEELFRLTQSPDRAVRAFVIHTLWAVYRDRDLTRDWVPPKVSAPTVGTRAKKLAAERATQQGAGVPARPANPPAGGPTLAQFLRRVLFELPPGPPEKGKNADPTPPDDAKPGAKRAGVSLTPIPAHRAKREAVVTMRDLALVDAEFARGILPLLEEFLHSVGTGERADSLVAVTRIRHRHPALARAGVTA